MTDVIIFLGQVILALVEVLGIAFIILLIKNMIKDL